jgi:hypothetical protein
METFWKKEMQERRSYYDRNNFRFDDADNDVVSCFKDIKIRCKKKMIEGTCPKMKMIFANHLINLRPFMKKEIIEKFQKDVEREKDV